MKKEVKHVRKSITQRKRMRGLNTKETYGKDIVSQLPQEEEKHGYFPIFSNNNSPVGGGSKRVSGFVLKGIMSIILFFGVALLFQTDASIFSSSKDWTRNALSKEFPFARVNQWYQDTFGTPMALAPQQSKVTEAAQPLALPVSGDIKESFRANGSGIKIAPEKVTDVVVLRKGVIIFAGNDNKTNKTVIVQHADGSKSTYGYLSSIDVHPYQFVANNQRLGEFVPSDANETVYFAIEKDNKYINPVQVIKVDDLS